MNKTSFIKTLVIATLMFAVFPSHSSAEHKMGSYFQAVVLSQEQSPDLDVRVGRYSMREATVNVSSVATGKPINSVKIFSMIRVAKCFFLEKQIVRETSISRTGTSMSCNCIQEVDIERQKSFIQQGTLIL